MRAAGFSVAIQGELMGPGVQSNREHFCELDLCVFDVFNIDQFKYLYPDQRRKWCRENNIKHILFI